MVINSSDFQAGRVIINQRLDIFTTCVRGLAEIQVPSPRELKVKHVFVFCFFKYLVKLLEESVVFVAIEGKVGRNGTNVPALNHD